MAQRTTVLIDVNNAVENGKSKLDDNDYKCGIIFFNKLSHLLKYECYFCPETYDNINFYCEHMSTHINEDNVYQKKESERDRGRQNNDTNKMYISKSTEKPPKEKIAHITISLSKASVVTPKSPEKPKSGLQVIESGNCLRNALVIADSPEKVKVTNRNSKMPESQYKYNTRQKEKLREDRGEKDRLEAKINTPQKNTEASSSKSPVSPKDKIADPKKGADEVATISNDSDNNDYSDFRILEDSSSCSSIDEKSVANDPLFIANEESKVSTNKKSRNIRHWRLQAMKALAKKQTADEKALSTVERKCIIKVLAVKNDLPALYREIAGLELENSVVEPNELEQDLFIDGRISEQCAENGKLLDEVVARQTKTFGDCLVISLDMAYRQTEDACLACEKKFRSLASLTMHLRSHHLDSGNSILLAFQCDICKTVFSKRGEVNEHMPRHFPNGFKCLLCRRKCSSLRNLSRHLKFVHLSGKHACTTCKKFYCGNRDLRKHNLQKHPPPSETPEQANFRCRRCYRRYESKELLEAHIRHHNEDVSVEPDICEICGKVTLGLREHQKMHAPKPKPLYFCTACKTEFKYNSALSNHLRRIHNSSIKIMKAGKLDPAKTITIKYRGKRPNYKRKNEHDYANNEIKKKTMKILNEGEIKPEKLDDAEYAMIDGGENEFYEYVVYQDDHDESTGILVEEKLEIEELEAKQQQQEHDKLQMLIEQCEGLESVSGEEVDKNPDYYYEDIIEEDFEEDNASNIMYEETISYVSDQSGL